MNNELDDLIAERISTQIIEYDRKVLLSIDQVIRSGNSKVGLIQANHKSILRSRSFWKKIKDWFII